MSENDPHPGPGRKPRAEQAAEVQVGFRVVPAELAEIDRRRGDLPRAVYLRRCALAGLTESGAVALS